MEFNNSIIVKAIFKMYDVNSEKVYIKGDKAILWDIDDEREKLRPAIDCSLFDITSLKPKGVTTLKLNEKVVVDLAKSMNEEFFKNLMMEVKINIDSRKVRHKEDSIYHKIKEYIYMYLYGKGSLDETSATIENFYEFMNPPMVYKLLSGNQVIDRAFNVASLDDNLFIVKDNLIYLKSDCDLKEIEEAVDFGALEYIDKKSGWKIFEARDEKFIEFLHLKLTSIEGTNYTPLCPIEYRTKIEEERNSLIDLFNEIECTLL